MYQLTRDDIKENIAIIKINKSYREGMSAIELYDVTRGTWKRKIESVSKADYVLAVAFGEVKEVYKVNGWMHSSKLNRETIPYNEELEGDRIGFSGEVAANEIRNRYIGTSVAGLYKRGEADPVKVILNKTTVNGIVSQHDINKAVAPASLKHKNDKIIVICPNCEYSFIKSLRCPECGQLILY